MTGAAARIQAAPLCTRVSPCLQSNGRDGLLEFGRAAFQGIRALLSLVAFMTQDRRGPDTRLRPRKRHVCNSIEARRIQRGGQSATSLMCNDAAPGGRCHTLDAK